MFCFLVVFFFIGGGGGGGEREWGGVINGIINGDKVIIINGNKVIMVNCNEIIYYLFVWGDNILKFKVWNVWFCFNFVMEGE